MINTVILKPTKACNAQCTYCSSPPDMEKVWRFADFKRYFDKFAHQLSPKAVLIWHGGEPLLAGPDFYRECWDYAQSVRPGIKFSVQSNLLLYSTEEWKDIFTNIFQGSISTSFDPDEKNRIIKGSAAEYSRQFYEKIALVKADGFNPLIIGTYTEDSAHLGDDMYQRSLHDDNGSPIRFNYRYPAGRASLDGEAISPVTYGLMLVRLFDQWILDNPDFVISPLDQMLQKVIGYDTYRCPWTNKCGGHFMNVEPNGDVYNCGDFADLGDKTYLFGNLNDSDIDVLMASPAAKLMQRRSVSYPTDCGTCEHFRECEGGCMRDSVIYGHGLGGKFHYCQSWKMVFKRIKEAVLSGEMDHILTTRLGVDLRIVKAYVSNNHDDNPPTSVLHQKERKMIKIVAAV